MSEIVGLYWEDWEVGREWTTRGRTMTEAAIETYAGLSGDYNPLHTDEEFARRTAFGTRIAHGPLTYAFAAGLLYQLHLYDDTLIALLGLDHLRFTRPVKIGDTLRARVRVLERRETSRPDRGIVRRALWVLNQRDEVVLEAEQVLLLKRRPPPAEPTQ
ncbi:MAG TPA: MaoC/PaaZ C-terminal domain-containing protein [Chloroflexota bacterium]|nr:MaoC/PaaZ C-terminal domain-containing protein [Chloroflexota bacterium]